MATKPLLMETQQLKVEVDARDLAAHVTVKSTGETLRMAGAQPDDVLLVGSAGPQGRSFADSPITIHQPKSTALEAALPALNLRIRISVEDADVVFELEPTPSDRAPVPRDVLYPRHFLLPRKRGAYTTFPLGQGSIIPATQTSLFHHREGFAEAVAHWLGGYTGKTGYCGIAETPDDLYQAVDHRPDSPASTFFRWLGTLGKLSYTRRARYHFAKGLDYVRQAKLYRQYCKKIGLFRSLTDKAQENPNVAKLRGAPILCSLASARREKGLTYQFVKFTHQAKWVEAFRKKTAIKNAVVHIDGWGYWGYDAMHPDTLPPNPDCGGAEGLSELARRVKALGYLMGLHDQYIDFYAHAPAFDERKSVVTEDGRPVRVNRWCGGLCGHLCYHHIPGYVRRNLYEGVRRVYPMYHNSPPVWKIVQPTAYYLDCFCRTVECWSAEHPMTRTQARQLQNESFQLTRAGADGQHIVLSVEHPRDFAIPYLDFGWSIGHLSADVLTTTGQPSYEAVGVPTPLWHLVFHDALCLPSPSESLLEALLYAQAPYFWLRGKPLPAKELTQKKVLLALHEDAGFAEMTDHQLLSDDGNVQKCVYEDGLEVQINKQEGAYRISDGKAKTKQTKKL